MGTYSSFGTLKGEEYNNPISVVTSELKHYKSAVSSGNHIDPTSYWHGKFVVTGNISVHRTTLWYEYVDGVTYERTDNRYSSGPNAGYLNSSWFSSSLDVAMRRPPIRSMGISAKLSNKMLSKIDSKAFNAGQFLAELSETASSIASLGTTIVRFGIAIKRGKWNKALKTIGLDEKSFKRTIKKKKLNTVGSRWLYYKFAILPLVYDVGDLAALYSKEDILRMKSFTQAHVSETDEDKRSISNGYDTDKYNLTGKTSFKIVYSINNPEVIAAKAIGLTNPVAALYELVPFSWLVDYAVGIGEFLNVMSATQGLSFSHGYISKKVTGSATRRRNQTITYGNGTINNDYSSSTVKLEGVYRRSPVTSFPAPQLRLTIDDLSVNKALNVAALIAVLRKA